MIRYNVWFSFKPGTDAPAGLGRVRDFLTDLKDRGRIHEFKVLRNRGGSRGSNRRRDGRKRRARESRRPASRSGAAPCGSPTHSRRTSGASSIDSASVSIGSPITFV